MQMCHCTGVPRLGVSPISRLRSSARARTGAPSLAAERLDRRPAPRPRTPYRRPQPAGDPPLVAAPAPRLAAAALRPCPLVLTQRGPKDIGYEIWWICCVLGSNYWVFLGIPRNHCSSAPVTQPSTEKMPSVYLYIPNIIGYFRIITNFIAFAVCYSNRPLFAILYFLSFVLDGVDGWFARKFNQASTFGAVLDMVTDRVSTACLLALLSQCYRPGLIFLMLLGLDITSHWFQMYSSFLSGKTSHKDVKHTGNWLLKLYYGYRPFMAFCCVSCEVLYIILFLFAEEKSTSLLSVCRGVLKQSPFVVLVFVSTLIGWAVKQVTNIIQMKTAADTCVEFDPKRNK